MAKKEKDDASKKPKEGKYEDKLKVKGSFLDIMKASVKDADNKSAKPKKKED